MGLFDKLKKVATTAPQTEESTDTAKENFSNLTDLQVLEKIDQYTNDFKISANKVNLEKLSDAINEFDNRVTSMPLSKRGSISQDWSSLKLQRGNLSNPMIPTSYKTMFADQISSFVGKIYTELSK